LPPLEPRQLTHEITRTNTSEQLLELWVQYQHAFNTLHISAFWNRLGKLVRSSRAEQTWVRSNGALMTPVREQTLQMLPELGTRSLSNTAHGLASARIWSRPPWSTVWEQLAVCATNQSAQYQPQNLANLAWAYATVGHKAPPLFEMIEGEARERVGEFAAQGLDGYPLVILADVCEDRLAISWRSLQERQVSNPDERHLEGSRNRCCAHGDDVDIGCELFDGLFVVNTEALLFVDNEESEIFEDDVAREQTMGADDTIDVT